MKYRFSLTKTVKYNDLSIIKEYKEQFDIRPYCSYKI